MLQCAHCGDGEGEKKKMPLNATIRRAMEFICFCSEKKLFSFSLPEKELKQLSLITEAFLSTQLEKGFFTLDFYKTLFQTEDKT